MRHSLDIAQGIGKAKDSIKAKSKIRASGNRSISYPTDPEKIPGQEIDVFPQCYALSQSDIVHPEASSKPVFTGL